MTDLDFSREHFGSFESIKDLEMLTIPNMSVEGQQLEEVVRSNAIEETLWATYGEMLKIVGDANELPQDLTTEVILHQIRLGQSAIATDLVNSYYKTSDDSDTEPMNSLELSYKLLIFREAVDCGDNDVLMALGDLRKEAEAQGPEQLGSYLLEELRVGWNLFGNLDALATIKQHAAGFNLDTKPALGELIVNLVADGCNKGTESDLQFVLDFTKQHGIDIDPSARLLVTIHNRQIKLVDVIGRLGLIDNGVYPKKIRQGEKQLVKFNNNGLRWLHVLEGKANKQFAGSGVDLKMQETLGRYLVVALDGKHEDDYIKLARDDSGMYEDLKNASVATRKYFGVFHPKFYESYKGWCADRLETWYKNYTSVESTRGDNIRDLKTIASEDLAQAKYKYFRPWANIIENLGFASSMIGNSLHDADQDLAANILGELGATLPAIESQKTALMPNDLVDQLRYEVAGNRPLKRLFAEAGQITTGHLRLTVQHEIYQKQRDHDSQSSDANIGQMKEQLLNIARMCLDNPLDLILFGEDNIRDIIKDVESPDSENICN